AARRNRGVGAHRRRLPGSPPGPRYTAPRLRARLACEPDPVHHRGPPGPPAPGVDPAPRATPSKGPDASMLDRLLGLFSRDIGIDPGAGNPPAHVREGGIGTSERWVVATDPKTRRFLAIGAGAKRMVGRTPASIIAVRPLRDGVISDFDVTEQM